MSVRGLVKVCFKKKNASALGLLLVRSGSAMNLLGVSPWGPLYALKCFADSSFLLPLLSPVHSIFQLQLYTCRDIWYFWSDFNVCFSNQVFFSMSALDQSWVFLESALGSLNRPKADSERQNPGLVGCTVC